MTFRLDAAADPEPRGQGNAEFSGSSRFEIKGKGTALIFDGDPTGIAFANGFFRSRLLANGVMKADTRHNPLHEA